MIQTSDYQNKIFFQNSFKYLNNDGYKPSAC